MLMSTAIGQTIVDYRGLEIQSPDPTGAAGLRLQNNFKALADRIGPCNYTATTDPGVTDDSAAGYYVGSLWVNTTGPTLWGCVDNTVGAAEIVVVQRETKDFTQTVTTDHENHGKKLDIIEAAVTGPPK